MTSVIALKRNAHVVVFGSLLFLVGLLSACKNDSSTSGAFESKPLEAADYVTGVDSLDFGLREGYTYRLFDASEDYLTWFEYNTGTLHTYNVNENVHQKAELTRGRGPTEYHSISSLTVVGETVYLADMTNGKVLAFDILTSEVSRVPLDEKVQIFRLAANGEGSLFFGKMFNPTDWTGVINLDNKSLQTASLDAFNMTDEFPNLYYQDGTMTISGARAVWATLYRPILYVFDAETGRFQERIVFDSEAETQVASEGPGNGPPRRPEKFDVFTKGIHAVPGQPGSVYLVLEGDGVGGAYTTDHLYTFDLDQEQFVGTYDAGIEVTQAASTKDKLYIFSEDTYKIYSYSIVN